MGLIQVEGTIKGKRKMKNNITRSRKNRTSQLRESMILDKLEWLKKIHVANPH